jgi:hypothetical protein
VPPNIIKQLDAMSAEDRRKMKRKFRKLWKKAYKKYGLQSEKYDINRVSRNEKSRRLSVVYRAFREDVLNHMKV